MSPPPSAPTAMPPAITAPVATGPPTLPTTRASSTPMALIRRAPPASAGPPRSSARTASRASRRRDPHHHDLGERRVVERGARLLRLHRRVDRDDGDPDLRRALDGRDLHPLRRPDVLQPHRGGVAAVDRDLDVLEPVV